MGVTLYHYTTKEHYKEILETGSLHLTPSNLIKPKHLHLDAEKGAYVDETDEYRPVVWLTSDNGASATSLGNFQDPHGKKTDVRISIAKARDMHPWYRWAQENGIDRFWFKSLKRAASGWRSFYVCEREIPVSEFVDVRIKEAQA